MGGVVGIVVSGVVCLLAGGVIGYMMGRVDRMMNDTGDAHGTHFDPDFNEAEV